MPRVITARPDPALTAQLLDRRPLRYRDAAGPDDDRPDFARAASGLTWLGDTLAIVQDDAGFVARIDADGSVYAVPLPVGPGGRRRFEKRLGNKNDKLDLEACIGVGDRLIAFGSGALARREVVVVVEPAGVRVVEAAALYAPVRAALGGAAVAVNLEGACVLGDRLRLFQRGNGAPLGVDGPVDAAVDLDLHAFLAWLDGRGPPSPVVDITWFVLGTIESVRYGFTDASALDPRRALILAAAEASPDAIDDGAVHGTLVGVLDDDRDDLRTAVLRDVDGAPAALKAEGIVRDRDRPDRALVVLDADDPDRPSELCTMALTGPW